MAKYARKQELVANTFSFTMFGKRRCDLSKTELREYNKIRQRISRERRRCNNGQ